MYWERYLFDLLNVVTLKHLNNRYNDSAQSFLLRYIISLLLSKCLAVACFRLINIISIDIIRIRNVLLPPTTNSKITFRRFECVYILISMYLWGNISLEKNTVRRFIYIYIYIYMQFPYIMLI